MKAVFAPHANLCDRINRSIVQSEIEGGVSLRDLPRLATLEVATRNRSYTIVVERDGNAPADAYVAARISGHPEFCPEPVLVAIIGSNWGGSMLKTAWLGRGMHMEFRHPSYRGPIVTSAIVDIRLLPLSN